MRSLNQMLQVEGHPALVRDPISNAIISTNDAEFSAYKKRRDSEIKRAKDIESQIKDIESLKNDMLEIKNMLNILLVKQG